MIQTGRMIVFPVRLEDGHGRETAWARRSGRPGRSGWMRRWPVWQASRIRSRRSLPPWRDLCSRLWRRGHRASRPPVELGARQGRSALARAGVACDQRLPRGLSIRDVEAAFGGLRGADCVDAEVRKILLGFQLGSRDSYESWLSFGGDLIDPRAALSSSRDRRQSIRGLEGAAGELWLAALGQRCTAHALRNVTGELPKRHHTEVKACGWKISTRPRSIGKAEDDTHKEVQHALSFAPWNAHEQLTSGQPRS